MAKKRKEKSFSSFVNNPVDFTLMITILLLLATGLIMVLSASSPSALAETGNSYSFFSKQLIFGLIGIVAMLFISKIDYRFYKRFYKYAWWIALILLGLVLIAGKTINGAKRWIYVTDTLSFQPSEIVKILMIIFYAGILCKNRDQLGKYGRGFFKHLLFLVPIILMLLLEPHFSASIVIIGICSIMMIMAGAKFWHFIITGGLARNTCNDFFDNKRTIQIAKSYNFFRSLARCNRKWMAGNTKFICYRIWRTIWSWFTVKVNKNIYIYQSHIMILFFQYWEKN